MTNRLNTKLLFLNLLLPWLKSKIINFQTFPEKLIIKAPMKLKMTLVVAMQAQWSECTPTSPTFLFTVFLFLERWPCWPFKILNFHPFNHISNSLILFGTGVLDFASTLSRMEFLRATVWLDWAKFRHFCTLLKILGEFVRVTLVFGKILILLWQKC